MRCIEPVEITALFTDFYELTMAQGYWKNGMNGDVVFDMFFRRNPWDGGFSVLAGNEPLLDALEQLRFSQEDLAFLAQRGFEKGFLDYLAAFRFSGDVWTFDEGTVMFPGEVVVRIHAPLIEAQIIEGLVLNTVNFQSLIATKTCRVHLAAGGAPLMEFGLRRAQGADGALSASRAAFIGGATGTSNTLAGRLFDIPVMGTMAHSWVMSYPTELEAFRAYAAIYPENSIFLIDTYNTLQSGLPNAIKAGGELVKKGYNFGVRLDSGDIAYLAREVRKALDAAGFKKATISVSNELTEDIITALRAEAVPIDSWGVGTHMVTGGNEASFTGVYKLAARASGAGMVSVMKFSDNPQKMTNPGVKDVWRLYNADGTMKADVLSLAGEEIAAGKERRYYHPAIDLRQFAFTASKAEMLLKKRLSHGKRTGERLSAGETIRKSRETMEEGLKALDGSYKRILNPHIYKVSVTEALKDLKYKFIQENGRGLRNVQGVDDGGATSAADDD